MQILIILALLIALIAVIFALQNTALVTVSFLVWKFDGSLALVVLLALLTGVLISILASTPSIIKNRLGTSGRNKKIKDLETRMGQLEEKLAAAHQELELYQVPPDLPLEAVQKNPPEFLVEPKQGLSQNEELSS